jgi:signal peptidase I
MAPTDSVAGGQAGAGGDPLDAPGDRAGAVEPIRAHERADEQGDQATEQERDPMVTKTPEKPPKSALSAALGAVTEVVVVVAMALAISLVVKTFLVQAFYIPSGSMENTLLLDDRVVVSKLTPGPFALHRGDIIVFKDPGNWLPATVPPDDGTVRHVVRSVFTFVGLLPHDSGEHLIKRVIGLPGDTVACCDSGGHVTVNRVGITEPYLYPGNVPSSKTFRQTVPAGKLWVMGDHREISEDSRVHGFVPESDVVGRAFVLVWPLSRATWLGRPDDVFAKVPAASGAS